MVETLRRLDTKPKKQQFRTYRSSTNRCDGKFLRSTDPAACCQGDDLASCPGQVCRENSQVADGGGVANMNKKGTNTSCPAAKNFFYVQDF